MNLPYVEIVYNKDDDFIGGRDIVGPTRTILEATALADGFNEVYKHTSHKVARAVWIDRNTTEGNRKETA